MAKDNPVYKTFGEWKSTSSSPQNNNSTTTSSNGTTSTKSNPVYKTYNQWQEEKSVETPKSNSTLTTQQNAIAKSGSGQKLYESGTTQKKGIINRVTDLLQRDITNEKVSKFEAKYGNKTNEDTFLGTFKSNYGLGRITQNASIAWNDYLNDPTEENRLKAERLSSLAETYQVRNAKSLDDKKANGEKYGKIGKSFAVDYAKYLPQLGGQISTSALLAAPGAIKGAVKGAAAASPVLADDATGVGVIDDIAIPIAAIIGGVKGSTTGMTIGSGVYSYNTMRGMAFKNLIDMGASEGLAKDAAEDEAIVSSLIEMGDTFTDMKLFAGVKGLLAGTAVGKIEKILAESPALIKWIGNASQEYGEEFVQEVISAANEARVEDGLGSGGVTELISYIKQVINEDNLPRFHEAGVGGFTIGMIGGGIGNAYQHTMQNLQLKGIQRNPSVLNNENITVEDLEELKKTASKYSLGENKQELIAEIDKAIANKSKDTSKFEEDDSPFTQGEPIEMSPEEQAKWEADKKKRESVEKGKQTKADKKQAREDFAKWKEANPGAKADKVSRFREDFFGLYSEAYVKAFNDEVDKYNAENGFETEKTVDNASSINVDNTVSSNTEVNTNEYPTGKNNEQVGRDSMVRLRPGRSNNSGSYQGSGSDRRNRGVRLGKRTGNEITNNLASTLGVDLTKLQIDDSSTKENVKTIAKSKLRKAIDEKLGVYWLENLKNNETSNRNEIVDTAFKNRGIKDNEIESIYASFLAQGHVGMAYKSVLVANGIWQQLTNEQRTQMYKAYAAQGMLNSIVDDDSDANFANALKSAFGLDDETSARMSKALLDDIANSLLSRGVISSDELNTIIDAYDEAYIVDEDIEKAKLYEQERKGLKNPNARLSEERIKASGSGNKVVDVTSAQTTTIGDADTVTYGKTKLKDIKGKDHYYLIYDNTKRGVKVYQTGVKDEFITVDKDGYIIGKFDDEYDAYHNADGKIASFLEGRFRLGDKMFKFNGSKAMLDVDKAYGTKENLIMKNRSMASDMADVSYGRYNNAAATTKFFEVSLKAEKKDYGNKWTEHSRYLDPHFSVNKDDIELMTLNLSSIMENGIKGSNGKEYVFAGQTSSNIKKGIVIMMEKNAFDKMRTAMHGGLTEEEIGNMNPNKYLANSGVLFTPSNDDTGVKIKDAVVLHDISNVLRGVYRTYMRTDDVLDAAELKEAGYSDKQIADIINNHKIGTMLGITGDIVTKTTDGTGFIISPKKESFQFRSAGGFKGLLQSFDFVSFFNDNIPVMGKESHKVYDDNGNVIMEIWHESKEKGVAITDKWGTKTYLKDKKAILFDSTVKFADKYGSTENFLAKAGEYDIRSIPKENVYGAHEESGMVQGKKRVGLAQLLRSQYGFTDEDMQRIMDESVNDPIKAIMTDNKLAAKTLGYDLDSNAAPAGRNIKSKMVHLFGDRLLDSALGRKWVRDKVSQIVEDAKAGKLYFDQDSTDYQWIAPDVIGVLEKLSGMHFQNMEAIKAGTVVNPNLKEGVTMIGRYPSMETNDVQTRDNKITQAYKNLYTKYGLDKDIVYQSIDDPLALYLDNDYDGDAIRSVQGALAEIMDRIQKGKIAQGKNTFTQFAHGKAKEENISDMQVIIKAIGQALKAQNIGIFDNALDQLAAFSNKELEVTFNKHKDEYPGIKSVEEFRELLQARFAVAYKFNVDYAKTGWYPEEFAKVVNESMNMLDEIAADNNYAIEYEDTMVKGKLRRTYKKDQPLPSFWKNAKLSKRNRVAERIKQATTGERVITSEGENVLSKLARDGEFWSVLNDGESFNDWWKKHDTKELNPLNGLAELSTINPSNYLGILNDKETRSAIVNKFNDITATDIFDDMEISDILKEKHRLMYEMQKSLKLNNEQFTSLVMSVLSLDVDRINYDLLFSLNQNQLDENNTETSTADILLRNVSMLSNMQDIVAELSEKDTPEWRVQEQLENARRDFYQFHQQDGLNTGLENISNNAIIKAVDDVLISTQENIGIDTETSVEDFKSRENKKPEASEASTQQKNKSLAMQTADWLAEKAKKYNASERVVSELGTEVAGKYKNARESVTRCFTKIGNNNAITKNLVNALDESSNSMANATRIVSAIKDLRTKEGSNKNNHPLWSNELENAAISFQQRRDAYVASKNDKTLNAYRKAADDFYTRLDHRARQVETNLDKNIKVKNSLKNLPTANGIARRLNWLRRYQISDEAQAARESGFSGNGVGYQDKEKMHTAKKIRVEIASYAKSFFDSIAATSPKEFANIASNKTGSGVVINGRELSLAEAIKINLVRNTLEASGRSIEDYGFRIGKNKKAILFEKGDINADVIGKIDSAISDNEVAAKILEAAKDVYWYLEKEAKLGDTDVSIAKTYEDLWGVQLNYYERGKYTNVYLVDAEGNTVSQSGKPQSIRGFRSSAPFYMQNDVNLGDETDSTTYVQIGNIIEDIYQYIDNGSRYMGYANLANELEMRNSNYYGEGNSIGGIMAEKYSDGEAEWWTNYIKTIDEFKDNSTDDFNAVMKNLLAMEQGAYITGSLGTVWKQKSNHWSALGYLDLDCLAKARIFGDRYKGIAGESPYLKSRKSEGNPAYSDKFGATGVVGAIQNSKIMKLMRDQLSKADYNEEMQHYAACRYQVLKDNRGKNLTEEQIRKETEKKFSDVVLYCSPMFYKEMRSEYARSNNVLLRSLGMFRTVIDQYENNEYIAKNEMLAARGTDKFKEKQEFYKRTKNGNKLAALSIAVLGTAFNMMMNAHGYDEDDEEEGIQLDVGKLGTDIFANLIKSRASQLWLLGDAAEIGLSAVGNLTGIDFGDYYAPQMSPLEEVYKIGTYLTRYTASPSLTTGRYLINQIATVMGVSPNNAYKIANAMAIYYSDLMGENPDGYTDILKKIDAERPKANKSMAENAEILLANELKGNTEKSNLAYTYLQQSKGDYENSIKNKLKDMYLGNKINEDQLYYLANKYLYSEKTEDKKTELVDDLITGWYIKKETGIEYSELDDAFLAGDIDRDTYIQYQMVNGKDEESAISAADKIDFLAEHPSIEKVTDGFIDIYNSVYVNYGISGEGGWAFYDAYEHDLPADKDEWGKSITNSKMYKVIEWLANNTTLTDEQKTALFKTKYSEKNLKYVPWKH